MAVVRNDRELKQSRIPVYGEEIAGSVVMASLQAIRSNEQLWWSSVSMR